MTSEIVVAHRGAVTPTIPEGTEKAYRYAVANQADVLEADIRWTKDGPDPDTVGTMILLHDPTLNRTTNRTGAVKNWLWSDLSDRCRTKIGAQRLWRLVDLVAYANKVRKSLDLEIKPATITDAEARQLWNNIKIAKVRLSSFRSSVASLNKIKKLDAAEHGHAISYGLIADGVNGWPTPEAVKAVGPNLEANWRRMTTAQMAIYRNAGIKGFLWTGYSEADYARMLAFQPDGVLVNDTARYNRWRAP